MKSALVLIDGTSAILVEPEKQALVYEVSKHFAQRWKDEIVSGKEKSIGQAVSSMFKKLSIEFDIVENVLNVDVLSALPEPNEETPPQEPQDEGSSAAAFGGK